MKRKKVCLVPFFLFFLIFPGFSIFRSPESGRLYYWLMAPDLLSLSMGYVGNENPSGMLVNPASSATIQNYKFQISGGFAPGFTASGIESFRDGVDFFAPFLVNGGFVVPTKYGNFTGYLSYMNMSNRSFGVSRNNDLSMGKTGNVYFGFSKDYSDTFAFGISGSFKFSYNPIVEPSRAFDVGAAVDIGLIFRPDWSGTAGKDSAWGVQDLQFALVFKELGKPLINYPQYDDLGRYSWNQLALAWSPAPFTPAFGVSFNLFHNGSTYWKILSDVSAPFFQNMTFSLGTEIQILKFLSLKGAYTFDLEGTLEYMRVIPAYGELYNIFNFSGGISFKFSSESFKKLSKVELSEKKHLTTEFSIDLAGRPYHNGAILELGFVMQFGVKDTLPPKITYTQRDFYVSPNFDGIQDTVTIDLDIQDERYIREWKMVIYDENQVPIRTIANKQERKESLNFKSIAKRFFAPKTGVPVPDKIEWDCRNDGGKLVPDGCYTFQFFAMDDNKNEDPNGTAAGVIYVDTKKPEIQAEVQNRIFSPNTGGNKDKLIIELDILNREVPSVIESTQEETFLPDPPVYEILEREMIRAEVKAITSGRDKAEDGRVEQQTWQVEIRDSSNKTVRVYRFSEKGHKKIEWDGRDENGVQVPDGVYKIVLYSRNLAGNIFENVMNNIIIDTEPKPIEVSINRSVFSPNGNSKIKTIDFQFHIPIKDGLENWKLEILDSRGNVVREYNGEGTPPEKITWEGKNQKGEYAKEGNYKGKLSVSYVNGNIPFGITPDFAIDITPPEGQVMKYVKVFSPNGDGNKDETVIEQVTTPEEEWRGYIYDTSGKTVKSYIWKSQAPKKLVWDGKDDKNRLLPDGEYDYQLKSMDRAGNTFESQKYRIKIDTENVPLFITYSLDSFNSQKIAQELMVKAKSNGEKGVSEWILTIEDDLGNSVYSENGTGSLPESVLWRGDNTKGEKVPDGNYCAELSVTFESGIVSQAKTGFFNIDTVFPELKIQAVNEVFSPNGDGNLDQFEVLQSGSKEELWEEYIYDSRGNVVFHSSYSESEPKSKEIWDGKDLSGNIAKNGIYRYVITGRDRAGNMSTASIDKIELKNIYTSAFLTLSADRLAPTGNGQFDTIDIVPFVGVKEDIDAYKIEILNWEKKAVKLFQGEKTVPEKITWDGKDGQGKIPEDGIYTAKMTVMYRFGNMPTVETSEFFLDTTAPIVKITYDPEYFSPDDDNVNDELNIKIDANDLCGIKEWKITVINPQTGKEFTSFSGVGKPSSNIKWNGLNERGELVESAEDYPVKIFAVDQAGNALETTADPIQVDILVIKESDGRLKIKISNIEFKPDSSQMIESAKNLKVLKMLAKALKKYGSYNITIEGHANKFTQKINEERAKSLSQERAKAILLKLKALGIHSNRMTAIGRGVEVPLVPFVPEATREELAKNRRVEFYLEK